MASKLGIARRYAKALKSSCTNPAELSAVELQLGDFVAAIQASKELRALIESHSFSSEEKWAVIASLSARLGLEKLSVDFLRVLASARRLALVEEIFDEYCALVLSAKGTTRAYVETAQELSKDAEAQLRATLEGLTKKKVLFETKVNPALIAGVKVKVDGKTLDVTLASSLSLFTRRLKAANA